MEQHESGEAEERIEGIRARFPELYQDLHRIAAQMVAKLPPQSLAASDLGHEAFLKLSREEMRRRANEHSELGDKPDSVFKACFGAACRDVLVDRARKRAALKHGGDRHHEAMHSSIALEVGQEFGLFEINDALETLKQLDPQLGELVECRIFGALTIPECADVLGVSPATVDRKWAFARAWLRERLA